MKKIILILLLLIVMILSLASCDEVITSLKEKGPSLLVELPYIFHEMVNSDHEWSIWQLTNSPDNCEDITWARYCLDCDQIQIKRGMPHIYTENYSFDKESHWYYCLACDNQKGMEKHTYQNGACTICGYTDKPTEGIVYEISTDRTCAYVTNYEGEDFFVVVASEYEGVPVTHISEGAFQLCTNLKAVIIPDSVTNIGASAFYNCSNLANIVIPHNVTNIGENAFSGCTNLISITIPESLFFIDNNAFYGCEKLSRVYITNIDRWCTMYFVNAESNPLSSTAALYLNNQLVTELIVSDNVYTIAPYAFYGCASISNVVIPDHVRFLYHHAFYNCSNLDNVIIGGGIDQIGNHAFANCHSLNNVIINDGVNSIGVSAFENCQFLYSITIPKSVMRIGSRAFLGCSKLKDVYFGGSFEEWRATPMGTKNTELIKATFHYNYVPEQ